MSDRTLDEQGVISYLQARLPEYMVPSALVHLDKLPLTINGKLDRKALPDPKFTQEESYVAPRSELEQQICQIWAETLGLPQDQVGIRDNFFRLGGNSILAIKLVNRLNKKLNNNVSVSVLFKQNTIEKLSRYLEHTSEDEIVIDQSKVSQVGEQILSFAQERLWFIEQYEGGTNAYNVPIVFKLTQNAQVELVARSIKGIVSRHEILRTLIKEDREGNSYQLVQDEQEHPLEIRRVQVTNQEQLDQKINEEVNHIYELAQEYPIRVCIYALNGTQKRGSVDYYLSVVIHHIAFDGWSVDVFLREFQAYYRYYEEQGRGLESQLGLPSLKIQYKDFAIWQRNYLSGERLDQQLSYWKNKLSGYETINLITDQSRPGKIDYRGKDIQFELDLDLSIALRKLAKNLGVSLYSLLLTGYYLMLRSYSNQNDLVLGTPAANRHYSQIENLIGFFVNSLALRVQIDQKNRFKN